MADHDDVGRTLFFISVEKVSAQKRRDSRDPEPRGGHLHDTSGSDVAFARDQIPHDDAVCPDLSEPGHLGPPGVQRMKVCLRGLPESKLRAVLDRDDAAALVERER